MESIAKTRMTAAEIHEDLRIKLVTATFEQGLKLKPAELCKDYGCSANALRELLFRLSTVGLVRFEDQRGFRVPEASVQRQHDLTTFRIMLEQQGVALSIANGGIEWEAQLSAAHYKLSHIESLAGNWQSMKPVLIPWCAAEAEFHWTLVSASQSPYLIESYNRIYDQFRQQLVTRETHYGYYPGNIAEHQLILEAALDRDTERCCRHISDHLVRNLLELPNPG